MKQPQVHVPYRNSALTKLLSDSIGGTSKTVVVATLSPSCAHAEDTVASLKFAARMRAVKNYSNKKLALHQSTNKEEDEAVNEGVDFNKGAKLLLLASSSPSSPPSRKGGRFSLLDEIEKMRQEGEAAEKSGTTATDGTTQRKCGLLVGKYMYDLARKRLAIHEEAAAAAANGEEEEEGHQASSTLSLGGGGGEDAVVAIAGGSSSSPSPPLSSLEALVASLQSQLQIQQAKHASVTDALTAQLTEARAQGQAAEEALGVKTDECEVLSSLRAEDCAALARLKVEAREQLASAQLRIDSVNKDLAQAWGQQGVLGRRLKGASGVRKLSALTDRWAGKQLRKV